MNKIISIIIPVYNVEAYLPECLDSVLTQNLTNFEIICVNDGSTDISRNILDVYKQKFTDIIIVDRLNGGLSAARNSGLKVATGKYILFLDSDDYLLPDTLQKLITFAELNDPEVIAFSAITNAGFEYMANFNYDKIATGVEYYEEYYRQTSTLPFHNAWLFLYKRSFLDIHNLTFSEGRFYEDVPFAMRMFFYAKKLSYLPLQVVYYRKYREGAITNTLTRKHLTDQTLNYREFYVFLNENKYKNNYFYEKICKGYIEIILTAVNAKYTGLRKDVFTKQDSQIMKHCAISPYYKKLAFLASLNPLLMYKYYHNTLPTYVRRFVNISFTALGK